MRQVFFAIITLYLALMSGVVAAQDFEEQVFMSAMLADIGTTELEMMQFGAKLENLSRVYGEKYAATGSPVDHVTRDNYAEIIDVYFDQFISPVIADARNAATDSFSEESYSKITQRMYQYLEFFPSAVQSNGIDMGGMAQLFLLPDIMPMTEEQLVELLALQKEVVTDIVGIEVTIKEEYAELFAERKALFEELEKAETDEERVAIQEKLVKVTQKTATLLKEPMEKRFVKTKDRLDTLLTAEQKAKLAEIKQDMPDYMKKALAKLKAMAEKDGASAAWRPGINSWMPGQGAPQDRTGHPGEARPEKTPKDRLFPE